MTTQASEQSVENPAQFPQRKRWTNAEFECMIKVGLFHETRAELIDGEIIEMSPMLEPHAQSLALLTYYLSVIFPMPEFSLRNQSPFFVGEGYRPEPDIAIVRRADLSPQIPPSSALLIVEVSDTTLRFDRNEKASLYARAGVEDYWILNLGDQVLEVRRAPRADETAKFGFSYGFLQTLAVGEGVSPLAAPDAFVQVGDLLAG